MLQGLNCRTITAIFNFINKPPGQASQLRNPQYYVILNPPAYLILEKVTFKDLLSGGLTGHWALDTGHFAAAAVLQGCHIVKI